MSTKPGRNEPCPCGSGRKVKFCCGRDAAAARATATPRPSPAKPAEQFLARAQHFIRIGQPHEAIEPLLLAAKALPGDPVIANDLGVAYLVVAGSPRPSRGHVVRSRCGPTFALGHFNLGLALEQMGEHDAALAAQYQAIALRPGLAEAHGQVGDLLARKLEHDEAARSYERAHAAQPDSDFGRRCEALALVEREPRSEAEGRLSALIARDASNGEAHLVLGDLLNEAGRFDEAGEPSSESSRWPRGGEPPITASCRRGGSPRRPAARRPDPVAAGRRAASSESAADDAPLRGRQGARRSEGLRRVRSDSSTPPTRSGGASAPFRSRRLRAAGRPADRAFHAASSSSPARRSGNDDETPVLVLGMPRSGTTLIERIVSSHPQVAGGGELPFWNEHGPPGPTPRRTGSRRPPDAPGDYFACCAPSARTPLRVTDKMPFNFLWIGLVHLLLPDARIVHCRRNPVDTCLSIYTTHFASNWAVRERPRRPRLVLPAVPAADGPLARSAPARPPARRRLRGRDRRARAGRPAARSRSAASTGTRRACSPSATATSCGRPASGRRDSPSTARSVERWRQLRAVARRAARAAAGSLDDRA